MRAGDILAWTSDTNFLDRQVVAATGFEEVHVAMAVSSHLLIEAVYPRIRVMHIKDRPGATLYRPPYENDDQITAAVMVMITAMNHRYDATGLLAVGLYDYIPRWRRFLSWVLLKRRVWLKIYWCSEIVRLALVAAGFTVAEDAEVSPGAIVADLKTLGVVAQPVETP